MLKIPTYLNEENYKVLSSENDLTKLSIINLGNKIFEIYYFGKLFDNQYIVDVFEENGDIIPCKIVAKCILTGKEILLFDGARYGYNSLFVDEFQKNKVLERKLKKLEIPNSKIRIEFGYSIDYEEEKEDYELDENNFLETINGEKISWNDLKNDGFDWICITTIDENKNETEICNLELA